jgi:hypothetical protein
MFARISLYIIAALLIAAHFLRVGNFIGVAFCVATPFLFFVRQRWSLLLLQALAYAAALVWLVTAWQIAAERLAFGQPWLRAALILVVVAAVSALAGGLLRSRTLQARYGGR